MKTTKNQPVSFASIYIRHHRNIILMMVFVPLIVIGLTLSIFIKGNSSNNETSAQVTCTRTITSGSISTTLNSMSSGQILCLDGTFNQSVSINKAGVALASTPGKTARINGRLDIRAGAHNVKIMNLYLNGNGAIESPRIVANNALFYGNQITNQGSTRGICFAIGEIAYDIFEVQGITIDSNRIFKCGTVYHDQGIYAENVRNAVIRNNYIYDNPDFAIQFYPSAQNSIFEYNVVDGNARGITFSSEGNKTSNGNIVRNNIITNSPNAYNLNYYWGGPVGTGNRAENNCLYNGSRSSIQPGLTNYVTVTGTVNADPMYVDRANKDFRLRAGSPCANMGPRSSGAPSPTPTPPPATPSPTPPPPTTTPTQPPATPSGNYFGKASIGSGWTSMSPDAKRGSKFQYTGPVGMEAFQVSGYLRGASNVSGSQTVNVAVYSDNNGQPGSLLAKGVSSRTVSAGQAVFKADFTLDRTVKLTVGANYWLMYHSGALGGVAEYSHESTIGALRWQSGGTDSFSDGPSQEAGIFNTDSKNTVIWMSYKTSTTTSPGTNPPSSPPTTSPPPPIKIPGSSPDKPVVIPEKLPSNPDGSYTGDFNGDGLNDIVRDSNNDGQIDPNSEIVIDGQNNQELTDTSKAPISAENYQEFLYDEASLLYGQESSTVTFKPGPFPEVRLPKTVVYTFLTAGSVTITGIGFYLALTKLTLLATFRGKWGL